MVEPLAEFVQLAGESDHVSCRTKPEVFDGHEMVTLPSVAGAMVRVGAPSFCTAEGKGQNPPVIENCPFVNGVEVASGWPIVPLTE